MKNIIRGTIAAVLSLGIISTTALAKTAVDLSQLASQSVQSRVEAPEPAVNKISLPSGSGGMRAVFITPETDFSSYSEFGSLFGNITELGMNSVIIETDNFYDYEADDSDLLNQAIDSAHKANLNVYITLDVNSLLTKISEQGGGLKDGFSAAAHRFAMKYGCEGILLTDYYTDDTPEMYAEYLRSGSGIGYENWLYETNRYIIRSLGEIVHKTSNSMAVGLFIEDMWANISKNPDGSDTADSVQSLYDGFCDTKAYIENGYADFIMVKAYGSTNDSKLNFEKVVTWWNGLALKNNTKTYICHLNERVGARTGWEEDQLLQQLNVMKKLGGSIGGSAFNSLASLNKNPLSSTDTLKAFYSNKINSDTLNEELKITSPSELNFVTFDNTVTFEGTCDGNFDVLIDGVKVEQETPGKFKIEKELNVGRNIFTVEHKGKKFEYSIDYKVDVLQTVYSLGYITVEDGTTLSFSANAYSGSNVYVKIGDDTIALTEKNTSSGAYSKYVGYYTVSGGMIGEVKYLGDITYYAECGGYIENRWGGNVAIAAKPKPVETPNVPNEIPEKSQMLGIDISSYQGNVDFEKVKAAGYDFVIIKAGEWNHTVSGFETYYHDAKEAGLYIGFYWYCDGETLEEISIEADACIEALRGKEFDLPIYMDIENQDQFKLGKWFCSEAIRTFCGKLEKAGYYTGLYANTTWLDSVIESDIKTNYTLWVADWRGYCGYKGSYGIWQYGSGYVPGIDFLTDLNVIDTTKGNPIRGFA